MTDEVDDLVSRLETWVDAFDMINPVELDRAGCEIARSHIGSAVAALRSLRKDRERMDFIEDCGVPGLAWESRMSTTGRGYRLHQHSLGMGEYATARDAIDAAMDALTASAPKDAA